MVNAPELKTYTDKKISVQLNGPRKVIGILRGYDVFLNITMTEAVEEQKDGELINIGTIVIRGNSIVSLEALDKL